MFRAARIAKLFIGASLLCSALLAQQKSQDITTRTMEGVVTAAAGQPAGNAVVQLKNTKTLQIRSFITSADGRYHFAGLGTDVEYQVKAQRDGATSPWKTLSVFNTKKTAVIHLKLNK
jgi:hypothetical protein